MLKFLSTATPIITPEIQIGADFQRIRSKSWQNVETKGITNLGDRIVHEVGRPESTMLKVQEDFRTIGWLNEVADLAFVGGWPR